MAALLCIFLCLATCKIKVCWTDLSALEGYKDMKWYVTGDMIEKTPSELDSYIDRKMSDTFSYVKCDMQEVQTSKWANFNFRLSAPPASWEIAGKPFWNAFWNTAVWSIWTIISSLWNISDYCFDSSHFGSDFLTAWLNWSDLFFPQLKVKLIAKLYDLDLNSDNIVDTRYYSKFGLLKYRIQLYAYEAWSKFRSWNVSFIAGITIHCIICIT